MKLTFWQFLSLMMFVALIWYVVFVWSPGQDRQTLIQRMNSMFIDSEEEAAKKEKATTPEPTSSDGWVR